MKGLVSTDKYMRGILNKDAGLFSPPKGVLSHMAILEMPSLPKLLCIRRRGDPRTPTSSRNRS